MAKSRELLTVAFATAEQLTANDQPQTNLPNGSKVKAGAEPPHEQTCSDHVPDAIFFIKSFLSTILTSDYGVDGVEVYGAYQAPKKLAGFKFVFKDENARIDFKNFMIDFDEALVAICDKRFIDIGDMGMIFQKEVDVLLVENLDALIDVLQEISNEKTLCWDMPARDFHVYDCKQEPSDPIAGRPLHMIREHNESLTYMYAPNGYAGGIRDVARDAIKSYEVISHDIEKPQYTLGDLRLAVQGFEIQNKSFLGQTYRSGFYLH